MENLAKQISREIISDLQLHDADFDALTISGKLIDHKLVVPIDQIFAGVHGACGVLLNKIWQNKVDRTQQITIEIPHAYLRLSSFVLNRRQGYPIYLLDPEYPTVNVYEARDGRFIFINGGHPRLRDRILRVLETPNDTQYITHVIKNNWDALALEDAINAEGSTAGMIRTKEEWLAHPQGKIQAAAKLITIKKMTSTKAEPFNNVNKSPLSGLKVLDLTSVLSGPSASRFLAEHGADVLSISSPYNPHIPPFAMDTNNGKRQAYLDFKIKEDLEKFKTLLSQADVFVEGWRLGVMEKYQLTPEDVQKIRPGIIHLTINCYGMTGPFSTRGGWEQIAQAVTGFMDINRGQSKPLDTLQSHWITPTDYHTGLLGAAGVLSALIKRAELGGGYHINTSLARTATWFVSKAPYQVQGDKLSLTDLPELYIKKYMRSSVGPIGKLSFLAPVVQLSETPAFFQRPTTFHGSDDAIWL